MQTTLVAVVNPSSSTVILSRTVSSISFSRNAAPYCSRVPGESGPTLPICLGPSRTKPGQKED
jgi:hypothetical protein